MGITDTLQPGRVGHAKVTVGPDLLADRVGSGHAAVYASPSMIALMEAAAVDCVGTALPDGYDTLGTHLDVAHRAPTPQGLTVTATATLVAVDGRKLTFEVSAHDGVELIGSGRHIRVVVDTPRFLARVDSKRPHRP